MPCQVVPDTVNYQLIEILASMRCLSLQRRQSPDFLLMDCCLQVLLQLCVFRSFLRFASHVDNNVRVIDEALSELIRCLLPLVLDEACLLTDEILLS